MIYTFQALSEEDCELWLDAMDGKEPMYVHPPKPGNAHHTYLDEAGFSFITKCSLKADYLEYYPEITYLKFNQIV